MLKQMSAKQVARRSKHGRKTILIRYHSDSMRRGNQKSGFQVGYQAARRALAFWLTTFSQILWISIPPPRTVRRRNLFALGVPALTDLSSYATQSLLQNPKVGQEDQCPASAVQHRVREAHPEVSDNRSMHRRRSCVARGWVWRVNPLRGFAASL